MEKPGLEAATLEVLPKASGTSPEVLAEVREFLEPLPPGRVLDLPCGRGACAEMGRRKGHEVIGADLRPERLSVSGISPCRLDLNQTLPFAAQSFDTVLSTNGFHRIWNLGAAAAEILRILRPGGLLLASVPNYASIGRRFRFLVGGRVSRACSRSLVSASQVSQYRRPITPAELVTSLESNGFMIVSWKGVRMRRRRVLSYGPLLALVKVAHLLSGERESLNQSWAVLLSRDFLVVGRKRGI